MLFRVLMTTTGTEERGKYRRLGTVQPQSQHCSKESLLLLICPLTKLHYKGVPGQQQGRLRHQRTTTVKDFCQEVFFPNLSNYTPTSEN